jgi:hypothetical protein
MAARKSPEVRNDITTLIVSEAQRWAGDSDDEIWSAATTATAAIPAVVAAAAVVC